MSRNLESTKTNFSLYTPRHVARRRYRTSARRGWTMAPYAAIISVLGAVNVYLFLLPMAHRL
jgi:hypothetical protein